MTTDVQLNVQKIQRKKHWESGLGGKGGLTIIGIWTIIEFLYWEDAVEKYPQLSPNYVKIDVSINSTSSKDSSESLAVPQLRKLEAAQNIAVVQE